MRALTRIALSLTLVATLAAEPWVLCGLLCLSDAPAGMAMQHDGGMAGMAGHGGVCRTAALTPARPLPPVAQSPMLPAATLSIAGSVLAEADPLPVPPARLSLALPAADPPPPRLG